MPPEVEQFLEREGEVAAIADAAAAARAGEGGLVLIDGPAGVGKTTLMRAARDAARDAGLQPLSARGNELDRPFGFGVIRQLFEPALAARGDVRELLTGAARVAASVLDVEGLAEEERASGDAFAIHNGLYWLTSNLASRAPLAILVDDLHWSDDESVAALAHLANRLEGLPALLVLASRIEATRPSLEALRRSASDDGQRLRPQPLGLGAVSAVVRAALPDSDDSLCESCLEASGGNPFLLAELVRSLAEGNWDDPATILDTSPERVTRELETRLANLSEAARTLARTAAVLGDGAPLRRATALADLPAPESTAAADSLVAAGILRTASPVEFLHPLIRAAIYAGIGPVAASAEHSRAARLMAEEGEPPPRIATQLLRCEPAGDEWAIDMLTAAAADAMSRGAPDAAATLLERALAEPPPQSRSQLLLELALAEAAAARSEPALGHAHEALAGNLGASDRTRGAMLAAGLLGQQARIAEAADILQELLPGLTGDPGLLREVEVALANLTNQDAATHHRTLGIHEDFARRVHDAGEGDPGVLSIVANDIALAGGDREEVIAIATRALEALDLTATSSVAGWSGWIAVQTLSSCDAYDAALRGVERGIEQSRVVGASLDLAGWQAFRAVVELSMGDLPAAEVDMRTSLEFARTAGWRAAIVFTGAHLGAILLDRGEVDEAERLLGDPNLDVSHGYSRGEMCLNRGRCRLAQGRIEEAVTDLRGAGAWYEAIGGVNPAAMPWRSQLAASLVELGQRTEARRLAAEELELARSFGAPRALSTALRGMATVTGGGGEIELLREAADVIEDSPARLERARVQAQLGAALRRERARGEAAREPLKLAIDLAHRCGARGLEEWALEELRATGARPRRRLATGVGSLTPSERRIAELAAAGRQNREIAESLFVTVDTVEFHLRNAYRKLKIGGREKLPDALADPG